MSQLSASPDPAKSVKWGSQAVDEMMIGHFEFFLPVAAKVAHNCPTLTPATP